MNSFFFNLILEPCLKMNNLLNDLYLNLKIETFQDLWFYHTTKNSFTLNTKVS